MAAGSGLCTFQTSFHTISAPSFFIHLFTQHIFTLRYIRAKARETGAQCVCLQP